MSKKDEALKLAQDLRMLADKFSEGWHDGIKIDASDIVLLSDAAKALAEQPAQQEPFCYHDGRNIVGKEYAGHSDVFALYTHPQAREPEQPTIPQGWKLVPVKPTPEQIQAGNKVTWPMPCKQVYTAMLNAAPQPAQPAKLKVTLEDRPIDIELAQYKRMFEAACSALAQIGDALGCDPEEGGAEPILAAIAELKAEQPAQAGGETIVQTFTGLPERKLRELLAGGWEVNGVCFQRTEEDGTVRRGAATIGGMVTWWNAEQPAPVQQEPLAYMVKAHGMLQRLSRRVDVADELACKYREDDPNAEVLPLYTTPPQRKPLTDEEFISMVDSTGLVIDPELAFEIKALVEAAHNIKENA